jgi:formylglycine-generating enzyme required for sulfatase activity
MKHLTLLVIIASLFFFSDIHSQNNTDKLKDMVLVPAGNYQIGIDSSDIAELVKIGKDVPHMNYSHASWWYGDEVPKHTVAIDSFYIDIHEVTNRQYLEFTKATGYKAEGDWRKYAAPERMSHPVVNVTWNDASAYAKWAGKRLPTEEEWEVAARGGKQVKWFPWGNKPDPTKCNYRAEGESFFDGVIRLLGFRKINTTPVMSYPPNGYGIYDVCGNVSEWCASDFSPYPGNLTDDEIYFAHSKNPKVHEKVIRGGNWESSNPVFIRITNRRGNLKKYFSYHLGFRCVK